ncbi:MAG: sirohydrochlorin cobaltochelatase [Oligoflexia bacterium]|nr:sirohydrochlorin cobaltochelatase [Oligoflexia bacterium]
MFPTYEIRWAYSSKIVREKLKAQSNSNCLIDSPLEALNKFFEDKFNEVIVQSLHVIAGFEFNALRDTILSFSNNRFNFSLALGLPLITSLNDIDKVNKYLLSSLPLERSADDAVIFFAHGSDHYSGLAYTAIQHQLTKLDKNAFLTTVEGEPDVNSVIGECVEKGIKRAYLIPYMSVVGDHIINDMDSEEKDSLKSILREAGIEGISIMKGLAENENIVRIWMDHLSAAICKMENKSDRV